MLFFLITWYKSSEILSVNWRKIQGFIDLFLNMCTTGMLKRKSIRFSFLNVIVDTHITVTVSNISSYESSYENCIYQDSSQLSLFLLFVATYEFSSSDENRWIKYSSVFFKYPGSLTCLNYIAFGKQHGR